MASLDLLSTLEKLPRPRVLVLGDLVLDRYTWGNADRISPEAPVMVLQVDRRETRLGGAANVCHMLRGLEANVACVGVIGNDADGQLLRDLLEDVDVNTELVFNDASRPTTTKERFIGRAATRHPSQILRVDSEDRTPLAEWLENEIIAKVARDITQYNVLLISDYGKGVCTPRVLQAVIAAARSAEIPVLVDPIRLNDWSRYQGATVIKANRHETEAALSGTIEKPQQALPLAQRLCERYDLQAAIITLDRDGMGVVRIDGTGGVFPTMARSVYDITGAGDLVLAMFGVCLGSNVTLEKGAKLANIAAGLKVERFGASVVTREEIRNELLSQQLPGVRKILTLEQAVKKVEEHRRRGESVVMTNGCFDLLHVGHVTNLAECSRQGDVLIVAINSDASVRKLKGPQRPVISENDRAAMLAALDCVSYVLVFNEDTPHTLLHALKPDVLVKGGTYTTDQVVGHEVVEAYGGRVCVTGVVEGISTTAILQSLHPESAAPAIAGSVMPEVVAERKPLKAPRKRAG
jgi:D-beta-D-heptose 7-phosphate kinase/D-beta-D-heptose 1-phosphate adenosyltransferase